MKIGAIPENIFERIALWLGIAPTPLADTHLAFMMGRTIMMAVKWQLFECLSYGPSTACETAARINTHPAATEKLLGALVHLGYVKKKGEHFSLSPLSRKWMLKDSPKSLYHKMLFHFIEWDIVQQYDSYLETGKPLDIHASFFDSQQWEMYQKAMRDLANIASWEIARVTPIPAKATRMLDIGGAHGLYSASLCKRQPNLNAVVLDLPEAIASSEILSEKSNGGRIRYITGDVLTQDVGEEEWDIIFIANLAHHFDNETNNTIAKKVARGLRKGGFYVILEFVRDENHREGDHLGALLDLYFSATSRGGIFSLQEIIQWQKDAALVPLKTIRLRTVPRHIQQIAVKV
jgi:SAM-dependent methyltransferase